MSSVISSNSTRFSRASSIMLSRRVSEMMSRFQPVNWAASRTFWPPRPIARLNWSSGTISSIVMFVSSISTFETSAGLMALQTNRAGSSTYGTMSIFSPRSSSTTDCTRDPRMPTHAPTGSTSLSWLYTATLLRTPGSRATATMRTIPS